MKLDIPELTPAEKLENEKLENEVQREDEKAAKRQEEESYDDDEPVSLETS